jgi:hypothetical protein
MVEGVYPILLPNTNLLSCSSDSFGTTTTFSQYLLFAFACLCGPTNRTTIFYDQKHISGAFKKPDDSNACFNNLYFFFKPFHYIATTYCANAFSNFFYLNQHGFKNFYLELLQRYKFDTGYHLS